MFHVILKAMWLILYTSDYTNPLIAPMNNNTHLYSCLSVSTVLQKTGGSSSEAVLTRGAQNALYSLAVDYLPKLLSYMPRIKTNKPGGSHCSTVLQ